MRKLFLPFNGLQPQPFLTLFSFRCDLVALPVLQEEMTPHGCQQNEKRAAGHNARETLVCFRLRIYFGFLSAFSVTFIFISVACILFCIDGVFFVAFFFFVVRVRFVLVFRIVILSLVSQSGCQNFILRGQDQFVEGGDLLVEFAFLAFVGQHKTFDDLQCIRVFGYCVVQVQVAHIFFTEVLRLKDRISFFGNHLHAYQ